MQFVPSACRSHHATPSEKFKDFLSDNNSHTVKRKGNDVAVRQAIEEYSSREYFQPRCCLKIFYTSENYNQDLNISAAAA